MERLAQFVRSQEFGQWEISLRAKDSNDSRRSNPEESAPAQSPYRSASLQQRRGIPSNRLCPGQDTLFLEESGIYRARISHPRAVNGPLVGTACLEAKRLPLHRQIVEFSRRARAAGADRVQLVPLFLLAGVHVMDDIPAEVEQARQELSDFTLETCPHLGSHPGIRGLLRHKLRTTASETLILLAHGSRRPGGNDSIDRLAQSLGGTAAFWAVPPSLESQVVHHMQNGVQRVAVLPYFLFAGSTTDAITHLTEELAERFPQMGFHLLPPLGPSPELARLVIDLSLGRVSPKAQQAPAAMQRVAFRPGIHSSSMVS